MITIGILFAIETSNYTQSSSMKIKKRLQINNNIRITSKYKILIKQTVDYLHCEVRS